MGNPGGTGIGRRLEYAGVRLLAFVLGCTDVHGATRIGAALGRVLWFVDRRHRAVAEDNLRKAYAGALPDREIRRIAREVYENIGRTGAEFVHGPRRLRGRAGARCFEVTGAEPLREAAGEGPAVFLSAHFGNWEHSVAAARGAGFDTVSVARPLDNPLLDRWIGRMRRATGTETVEKRGALRGLLRVARQGRSVAMLMDQNAGRHGMLVPFFGRPCSTIPAGVALARRLGAPVSVGTMERRAPGIHRLRLGPPMYVRDGEGGEKEALVEVNRQLEGRIRERPADWLWLHRRWRVKDDWGLEGGTDSPSNP